MKTADRPIAKFGVVGCGRVVHQLHVPVWRYLANAQLVAACDASTQATASICADFPGVREYRTLDAFLADAKDLDFVVLATPGATHAALADRILDAGLHLLCEKPLALRFAEAARLYDIADLRNVMLTPLHNYSYKSNSLRALSPASLASLGDIMAVNVRFHSGPLFEESAVWMHEERANRVLLFDFAYHMVDLALQFLGPLSEIRFVDSEEDSMGLQYVSFGTLHKNGARGMFELMLEASCRQTEIEVVGESGAIALQFYPDGLRRLPTRDNPASRCRDEAVRFARFVGGRIGQRFFGALPSNTIGHARLYDAFVSAINGVGANPIARDQALYTLSLLTEVAAGAYARPALSRPRVKALIPGVAAVGASAAQSR